MNGWGQALKSPSLMSEEDPQLIKIKKYDISRDVNVFLGGLASDINLQMLENTARYPENV